VNEIYQQLLFYMGALWRRRWMIFAIAAMIAGLGWAGVSSLPNEYRSSAKIYVDTATILSPLLAGVAVEENVDRQIEIMRRTLLSRPNIEQLARMTDMDIEASTPAGMEVMLDQLEKRISLTAQRDNLFDISYVDRSPQRARDVVQALTTLFVENNLGRNRADMDNAQGFLDRQIAEYEQKLNEAEDALARFQQGNAAFLPGQTGLQSNLAEAREVLSDLLGQLQDTEARQRLLERELAETPQILGQTSGGMGPPTNLEVQIIDLQSRLEELESRYTGEHPDVVVMRRRLEAMMSQHAAFVDNFGQSDDLRSGPSANNVTIPNPVYADLRMELVRERTNAETLREKVGRARQAVDDLERKVFQVPEVEAQMKRLTRDYDVIRKNYETLLTRRESARISSDREQAGSRVNFRIIEAASVPLMPSGPPRALFLAAILMMSFVAGGAVAWLLAVARVTYGSVDHLKRDFDFPVIGFLTVVGHDDPGKGIKDKISLGASLSVLLAVFIGLLYIESRFGIPMHQMLAYGLCLFVFIFGLIILVIDRLRPSLFRSSPMITSFDLNTGRT
jgi:polysaccharide chain length determinant protein (PEP-CTERM system associated)